MYLESLSKAFAIIAASFCVWTSYQIWITPIIYEGIEISSSTNSAIIENKFAKLRSFSEVSLLGVVPLVIPVLITFLAMWAAFKFKTIVLIVSTLLLVLFWYITGFSIGVAYSYVVIFLSLSSASHLIAKWVILKENS